MGNGKWNMFHTKYWYWYSASWMLYLISETSSALIRQEWREWQIGHQIEYRKRQLVANAYILPTELLWNRIKNEEKHGFPFPKKTFSHFLEVYHKTIGYGGMQQNGHVCAFEDVTRWQIRFHNINIIISVCERPQTSFHAKIISS